MALTKAELAETLREEHGADIMIGRLADPLRHDGL